VAGGCHAVWGVRGGTPPTYLSRGTFIHNEVLAKAQFKLFLSIYIHAEEENKSP